MILSALLFGAAAIAAVGIVGAFWNDIVDWLKRGMKKVKEMLKMAVYGVKVFVKKIAEAVKEISKHYSKDNVGKWHETVVTRQISESEVPPEILAKANSMGNEVDISQELELQLA